MKPSQLARSLRHIAAKIENSKKPRRDLVAKDLKRVIAAVEPQGGMQLIGNINGATGTFNGIQYKIQSVDGGMEKNQDAHVELYSGSERFDVSYSTDSRAIEVHVYTGGGEAEVDFNNLPESIQAVATSPSLEGVSDFAWMCIGDAIKNLCSKSGVTFDEDLINYSIDDGQVSHWNE